MIEIIKLEPTEWKDLPRETHDELLPTPDQCVAVIAVDKRIPIGRAFLVSVVHVEGIWIEKSKRNKGVMSLLVEGVESEARRMNLKTVFAYAVDLVMEDYIERLGYEKLPWSVWRKAL